MAEDTTPYTSAEEPCPLFLSQRQGHISFQDLKAQIEEGNTEAKIDAMQKIILLTMSGERTQSLLMTVIRFVLPSNDHRLKKLLLLFLESVDKKGQDGKLLHEMILICDKLMRDLNHSNEYVRGITLRFLCRLPQPELLEPLIPSVRECLAHRHAYVRRNAVITIGHIFKKFESLLPDAPELVAARLEKEGDPNTQRAAYAMLNQCSQDRAVMYLGNHAEEILTKNKALQLVTVNLIKKACQSSSGKSRYFKILFDLLEAKSQAVQYEAANALISLAPSPSAAKTAAMAFIELLSSADDNNIKLIVLNRLSELKKQQPRIMEELVMDVLRTVSSPHKDIRKQTLDIVMDLVTSQNVESIISVLRKEVTRSENMENGDVYRQQLVQTIHSCAVKFPEVAQNVVGVLMDFLGDCGNLTAGAMDVVAFIKEVIDTHVDMRPDILSKMLETFHRISSAKVSRAVLWVIGEYCEEMESITSAFLELQSAFGAIPLLQVPVQKEEKAQVGMEEDVGVMSDVASIPSTVATHHTHTSATAVLSDGTYATQSAVQVSALAPENSPPTSPQKTPEDVGPKFRNLILKGDFYLASVFASTLTKLVLRRQKMALDISEGEVINANVMAAEAVLILQSVLEFAHSLETSSDIAISLDAKERIGVCVRVMADKNVSDRIKNVFLSKSRNAFESLLKSQHEIMEEEIEKKKKEESGGTVHAEDLIVFPQLKARKVGTEEVVDDDQIDLAAATGESERPKDMETYLSHIHQLTGISDPVYAEAEIRVHAYDIVLDILVVNQTADTLQNMSLELATLGDLKLCERPQTYTIGPCDQRKIRISIKVSSTETGIIFGNIVYDIADRPSEKNCVVLNDMHIDIIDYIHPGTLTNKQFRRMWAEFEWENKVAVNTNYTNLEDFLAHMIKETNMRCLTSGISLEGDCLFICANLYARSIFEEDAVCNISMEKTQSDKISGFIRIRSRTQGIALSLGDKMTLKQNDTSI